MEAATLSDTSGANKTLANLDNQHDHAFGAGRRA
jgi:hypothetical protein